MKIPEDFLGPYIFYNGEVKLWFSPKPHIYYREFKDALVPQDGVTTILKIIDKSEALVPWAAKMVAKRAVELMPKEHTEDFEIVTKIMSWPVFVALMDEAKKAPRQIKEDAGDIGSIAHACIEDSIQRTLNRNEQTVTEIVGWPTDQRASSCVTAAFDWMNKHHVRWLETERKIYSREYKYAGTMDGLALVDSCKDKECCSKAFKDALSLIDWKSSNGLWVEYCYQTAGYQQAYQEESGKEITDRFILRLGKEDGKFQPWHLTNKEFKTDIQAFLLAVDLSRVHYKVKKRMGEARKRRA